VIEDVLFFHFMYLYLACCVVSTCELVMAVTRCCGEPLSSFVDCTLFHITQVQTVEQCMSWVIALVSVSFVMFQVSKCRIHSGSVPFVKAFV
jgi:hypothetical protein